MWLSILKGISDKTRLRILNLLFNRELNVNEIIEVLNTTQSNVSKHLKMLKSIGLVKERKDGTWRFYSFNKVDDKIKSFLEDIFKEDVFKEDIERLSIISEKRNFISKKFFLTNEGQGLGQFYSLDNLVCAFAFLIPNGYRVLDAGCGEGRLLKILIKNRSIDLYAIDFYRDSLNKSFFSDNEIKRIKFYKKDITKTGFDDSYFDIIFMNMVLHHIGEPKDAINEVSRVLKSGGKLIIVDFYKHNNEFMRDKYGDIWLGFDLDYIKSTLSDDLVLKDYYLIENNKNDLPDNFIIHIEKR